MYNSDLNFNNISNCVDSNIYINSNKSSLFINNNLPLVNKESVSMIDYFSQAKINNLKLDPDKVVSTTDNYMNLECPICLMIPFNSVLCSTCYSVFCKTCINEAIKKCPLCSDSQYKIISSSILPVDYVLKNIQLKCKNAINGCQFHAKLGLIEEHESKCLYYINKCSEPNCGDLIVERFKLKHYLSTCKTLRITCFICVNSMNFNEFYDHFKICINEYELCSNCLLYHQSTSLNIEFNSVTEDFNDINQIDSSCINIKKNLNCPLNIVICDVCGLPDFKVDIEKKIHKCFNFDSSFNNLAFKDINISMELSQDINATQFNYSNINYNEKNRVHINEYFNYFKIKYLDSMNVNRESIDSRLDKLLKMISKCYEICNKQAQENLNFNSQIISQTNTRKENIIKNKVETLKNLNSDRILLIEELTEKLNKIASIDESLTLEFENNRKQMLSDYDLKMSINNINIQFYETNCYLNIIKSTNKDILSDSEIKSEIVNSNIFDSQIGSINLANHSNKNSDFDFGKKQHELNKFKVIFKRDKVMKVKIANYDYNLEEYRNLTNNEVNCLCRKEDSPKTCESCSTKYCISCKAFDLNTLLENKKTSKKTTVISCNCFDRSNSCKDCTVECSSCEKRLCGQCYFKCYFEGCSNIYCQRCIELNKHQIRPKNSDCIFSKCKDCNETIKCIMSSVLCSKCDKRICSKCFIVNHDDHNDNYFTLHKSKSSYMGF